MTNKSIRDYINLVENAQTAATTPKITFAQTTPGSWSHIDILVNGVKQFIAAKTIGPGFWGIYNLDGSGTGMRGGSNKTQLKAQVLDYLSKQYSSEEQLEETTPEAIAKIDQITRR